MSLARLFKAGTMNAYPLSVAAATVENADQAQPSLPRPNRKWNRFPGFKKPG